ncbi:Flap endonuclease GEN 1 [Mycena kentingensis (nom. inval.)]|nr:Flap endonuclease GEN 1 [Mycena kentingensis (nom. inval.)]
MAQAPGEAEAELAYLNKSANIDAIITTDSDAFVFGGICVLQMNGSKVFEEISVYEATNLASSVGLDAVGFLLVALMAGGDYDDGILGCSARTAHRLAQHGFGTRLVEIFNNYRGDARTQRLDTWRKSVRFELETNPSGRLECAHPEVARKITRSFPDSSIVDLYRRPMTSQSSSSPIPRWIPVQPELATISKLATLLLGWKGSTKAEKFHRVLWPGVAFRLVSSRYVLYNNVHRRLVTPSCSTTLVKLQRKRGSQTELTIRVSVEDFCAQSNVAALESSALLHIPETVLAVATRDVEAMTTSFSIRPDVVQAIRNATNSSRLLDPPVVVEPNAPGS